MKKKTVKHEDFLIEHLKDPVEASAYLNAHLEDPEDDNAEELFLLALSHVAKAYGVSDLAKATQLGRESLYKTLSATGNPKLTTLVAILNTLGLKISVVPKAKAS
jgi:probable addiction module antidote protein